MGTIILRRRKLGKTSTEGITSNMKNHVSVVRNDKYIPEDTDMVIRWGCTSTTNINNTLNTAKAIHQVNDKIVFRKLVQDQKPEYVPKTWFKVEDWLKESEENPVVIFRPYRHAQGRNLLLVSIEDNFMDEVRRFISKFPAYYISKYIDKVSEYRVFIAQGRAVWVARKIPADEEAIAWNVARGGRFENTRWNDWPLKAIKVAIEVFNMTELDFGGVDIMLDSEGNPYVLEINSAPSQTSPYRQECVGKVFDYILENNKKRIPITTDRKGGYLKFIHPALDEQAY